MLLELSLKPLCQAWELCCQSIAEWPYEIGTQIIFVLSCPPVKLHKREAPAVKHHETYKYTTAASKQIEVLPSPNICGAHFSGLSK